MKLYATPLSHFSRKVRILLDLYSIPYEFIDIGSVVNRNSMTFGNNPLMKVPVLVDGNTWIIESDHIAKYLVDKFDKEDLFRVNTNNIDELNIRSILNGIMSEEVKIILAKRTFVPLNNFDFFEKSKDVIDNGLTWLENNSNKFNIDKPTYKEFHLVCSYEHLSYYDLIKPKYSKIKNVVSKVLSDSKIQKSSPFILKPKD